MFDVSRKIEIFISSACGERGDGEDRYKYNLVRKALKCQIERTGLANVYTFEHYGASSVDVESHYLSELKKSDLCIFLIDNEDDVPQGVLKEFKFAKENNIKSIYYFCNEFEKKETNLERQVKNSKNAKILKVKDFQELIVNPVNDLIKEIVAIYIGYCEGELILKENLCEEVSFSKNQLSSECLKTENKNLNIILDSDVIIDGANIKELKKAKDTLLSIILNRDSKVKADENIDREVSKFINFMFNKSLKFDIESLLIEIKNIQKPEHYRVTKKRWESINQYYSGNFVKSIYILKEALEIAEEANLPDWIIKDILIDLRNQKIIFNNINNISNRSRNNKYQQKLTDYQVPLYYPALDRKVKIFYENIINKSIKDSTKNLNTISLGNALEKNISYLTDILFLSIINGSLTQIELFYTKVHQLIFFYSEEYSDWEFDLILLKTGIKCLNRREYINLIRYKNKRLAQMKPYDAREIYEFSKTHPIEKINLVERLRAMSLVGYFLNDEDFNIYWEELYNDILYWLKSPNVYSDTYEHMYETLKRIYFRIDLNDIGKLCYEVLVSELDFIRKNQILKLFIYNSDIKNMDLNIKNNILEELKKITKDEKKSSEFMELLLELVNKDNFFKPLLTPDIKSKISNLELYNAIIENDDVKLFNISLDIIKEKKVDKNNCRIYSLHYIDPYFTIKNILEKDNLERKKLEKLIEALMIVILDKNEEISSKINAIDLLVYLCLKDITLIDRNKKQRILNNKESIESGVGLLSDLNDFHLTVSSLFLYYCLGESIYRELISKLPKLQNDISGQISLNKSILNYLSNTRDEIGSLELELIILQNSLSCCNSDNESLRASSLKILLLLLEYEKNKEVILDQIIYHSTSDSADIKKLILDNIEKIREADEDAYVYVMNSIGLDNNFLVKEKYNEIKKLNA